jgi:hypothetical protein
MAFFLHFIAGLMAGSLFGAKTLVVLVLALLLGEGVLFAVDGVVTGLIGLLVGQTALQMGYLGGVFLRSALDRAGINLAPQPSQLP